MLPWTKSISIVKNAFASLESFKAPKYPLRIATKIQHLINHITGYDSCERLKDTVLLKDQEYSSLKDQTTNSRSLYFQTIEDRAKCQRREQ